MTLKLTNSTMFDPPDDVRVRFDAAMMMLRRQSGASYALHIDGADLAARHTRAKHSPIDRGLVLGLFSAATEHEVELSVDAAARANPEWRATPDYRPACSTTSAVRPPIWGTRCSSTHGSQARPSPDRSLSAASS